MDYVAVRKFIVKKLLDVTMEWNNKVSAYPVKPQGMSEQQQTVWSMLTTQSKIGSLSEMESRAFRNMAEEVLGTKIPDTKNKILSEFQPYVCLTVLTNDFGIAAPNKVVMKKMSGPWVGPSGRLTSKDSIRSEWARLPTQEEIEDLISGIPDESIVLPFSGLLNFKKSKETMASLVALIEDATEKTFASVPTCAITGKEFNMYKKSWTMSSEYRELIFMSVDMEYDDEKAQSVHDYIEAEFAPAMYTSVCTKAHPEGVVLSNSNIGFTSKGIENLGSTLSWSDITRPSAEQIKKLADKMPIGMVFPALPEELREKMLAEVKLE